MVWRYQYLRRNKIIFTYILERVFAINESTRIQTISSSCIDLVFTDQPNLSLNSGVHASLHPNCHHQIVHTKFNLNISYPLPPSITTTTTTPASYMGLQKSRFRLFNKKDIDAQVAVFNETMLNVFRNYVTSKCITTDDKDPVWMNETIKLKIKAKTIFAINIKNRSLKVTFCFLWF